MKKIGILSDTHGYWDDRYATHFAGCDEIWHAGDIGTDEVIERLNATGNRCDALSALGATGKPTECAWR